MHNEHLVGDMYTLDSPKQQAEFFPSYSADPICAPLPEQFETDIDNFLNLFPDFPAQCFDTTAPAFSSNQFPGPLSEITAISSQSCDSRSTYSSIITDNRMDYALVANFEPTFDFNFNTTNIATAPISSDYSNLQSANLDAPFFPIQTSTSSIPMYASHANHKPRAYSDYASGSRTSTVPSDYYSHSSYTPSYLRTDNSSEEVTSVAPQPISKDKNHQCDECDKAFSRAHNLKMHKTGHLLIKPRPFICTHPSCGTGFTRKHDLGRHIAALHPGMALPPPSKKRTILKQSAIGVQRGVRSRCNNCGRSCVGRSVECDCAEIR